MAEIISTTKPNSEGELLWCVHFKSSYYDSDERMPGTVPIDGRCFVLAKSRDDAISKAEPEFAELRARKRKDSKEEIEATVAALENLVAARDCSNDGRLGFHSTSKWNNVELSSPADSARYRLGVCLIPIK